MAQKKSPLPIILAISTSTGSCSAALRKGNEVFFLGDDMPGAQAENLCELINDLLKISNTSFKKVTHLAVDIGPGSFTGIRVATSYAAGVALASQAVKVIPLNILQTLLMQVEEDETPYTLALINANRQEYYFAKKNNKTKAIEYGFMLIEDAEKMFPDSDYSFISSEDIVIERGRTRSLDASRILAAAEKLLARHKLPESQLLEPFYIKDPKIN